jgi:hypothetical protein
MKYVLSDWIDTLTTRTPRPVRAMGYWKEVRGIRARYDRVASHWATHVANTKATILDGVGHCRQFRKAVILGGGLLHDVPLEELAATFHEVILVDLVHPRSSRRATAHLTNVTRVAADISGTIDRVYAISDDPSHPLPETVPTLFLDDPEIDYTASVNLLSQLPCMPMTYLHRRGGHATELIREYARGLIRSHITYLKSLPGIVTLVTDFERLKRTPMNSTVETRDLFFGERLPMWGQEWDWRLAPCPEADPRHHYDRRVVGIPMFSKYVNDRFFE